MGPIMGGYDVPAAFPGPGHRGQPLGNHITVLDHLVALHSFLLFLAEFAKLSGEEDCFRHQSNNFVWIIIAWQTVFEPRVTAQL